MSSVDHSATPGSYPPVNADLGPVSAARCFKAMVLPHLLFVPDFMTRAGFVQDCLAAWNAGLAINEDEREKAIEAHCAIVQTGIPFRSPEFSKLLLRTLIEYRRRVFGWLRVPIAAAVLIPGEPFDVLRINAGGGGGNFELMSCPPLSALDGVLQLLCEVEAQVAPLNRIAERIRLNSGAVPDMWATRLFNSCQLLLAELAGYQTLLAGWQAKRLTVAQAKQLMLGLEQLQRMEGAARGYLAAVGADSL